MTALQHAYPALLACLPRLQLLIPTVAESRRRRHRPREPEGPIEALGDKKWYKTLSWYTTHTSVGYPIDEVFATSPRRNLRMQMNGRLTK
ncbi:hypothetical protein DIPPA_08231 [Diplonema papillatum]|nr:hypothetical protein DIPPA_08231 [Diplonema papillatum]